MQRRRSKHLGAKRTTEIKVDKKNVAKVIAGNDSVYVVTDEWGDTTHIKIGNQTYKVIEGTNSTYVN
jgi:hypothetical protein